MDGIDQAPLLRRLCAVAAVLTAVATLGVYTAMRPFTVLALGTSVGFATYAVLGEGPTTDGDDTPAWLPPALTVTVLAAIAVAIVTLEGAYYAKPLAFYVAIAVAAGGIVARVIVGGSHGTDLALTGLYGGATFLSNQLAFPLGIDGPDVGVHVRLSRTIVETGHVEPTSLYAGFPGQHVLAATVTSVGNTPLRPTYRLVGVGLMVFGLPVTYLIGRKLGGKRFAVLATVLYASMDYAVYRAGHPSKLAYALPLVLLVMLCLAALYDDTTPPSGVAAVFLLVTTALAFTHHYSVFVGVVMAGTVVAGAGLWRLLEEYADSGRPLRALRRGVGGDGVDVALVVAFGLVMAINFFVFSGFSRFFANNVMPHVNRMRRSLVAMLPPLPELPSLPTIELPGDSSTAGNVSGGGAAGGGTAGSGSGGAAAANGSGGGAVGGTQAGGASQSGGDVVKQLVRFEQIPDASLFINTVGSGLLVALAVVGALWYLRRRTRLSTGMLVWTGVAGLWMVFGVVLTLPFTLPQRLYVVAQITVLGFFGARGALHIKDAVTRRTSPRAAAAVLVAIVTLVVFFSTASTIAGIETSPFNDDVPHRTWYKMVEEEHAKDAITTAGVQRGELSFARGLPADPDGRIRYEEAEGSVVVLNRHKILSGVIVEAGHGRFGTASYAFAPDPDRGLGNATRFFDNGVMDAYVAPGDRG